ncbi:MAG: glycoside hydrolase family 97 N-terminal domain-containing protein [Comamonadaceae bacterium]|nr:glycoside hydrolase family 97 N-terminal domain-containing protein [Comamonadaceae bacterium]
MFVFLAALLAVAAGMACDSGRGKGAAALSVASPDGRLVIALSLEAKPRPYLEGERLYYRVTCAGTPVLADSPLGLDLLGAPALELDLEVLGTEKRSNDSTWENAFGAQRTVPDRYNELVVSLKEKNAPNRRLDVALRAYDEGVAFRYSLPKQDAVGEFTLAAESTGFYFAAEARALALNLGRWDTSNEGPYAWTPLVRDQAGFARPHAPARRDAGRPALGRSPRGRPDRLRGPLRRGGRDAQRARSETPCAATPAGSTGRSSGRP